MTLRVKSSINSYLLMCLGFLFFLQNHLTPLKSQYLNIQYFQYCLGSYIPLQILVCAGRLRVDLYPGSLPHHLCHYVDFRQVNKGSVEDPINILYLGIIVLRRLFELYKSHQQSIK